MSATEFIKTVAENPTTAIKASGITAGTALATDGTGWVYWLEWIPQDIGSWGIITGMITTIILTFTAVRSRRIQDRKNLIEIEIMQREK